MKVRLEWTNQELQWWTPMDSEGFVNALADYGIELVEGKPDVVFASSRVDPTDYPTIVLDQWDTSGLTKKTWEKWRDHNVVAFVCPIFDPQRNQWEKEKPIKALTTMLWQCWEPWHHDELPAKTVDVSFAGTVRYNRVHHAYEHRENLVREWHQLGVRVIMDLMLEKMERVPR